MTETQQERFAGQCVELVALDPDRHAEAMHLGSHGPEKDDLWRFLRDGPFPNAQAHRDHLARLCASGQFSGYAIIHRASSAVVGQAALMKFSPEHRSAEIGYVLFLPALQRTRGGTEALFLLLCHTFETLGLRRCEWRCDSQNAKSEQAALRLGFRQEGYLRQHMLVKGRSRDTMIFSLLDTEWPDAKAVLTAWLSDENFDGEGRAKRSLSNIRAAMCR